MQAVHAQGWRHWRAGASSEGPSRGCISCSYVPPSQPSSSPCWRALTRGRRQLPAARFSQENRDTSNPDPPPPAGLTPVQLKARAQEAASTAVSDLAATTTAADPSPDAAATGDASLTPAAPGRAVSPVGAAASPAIPQPPGFQSRRLLTFSCLVLGYAGYYLTRNSLTYTAPVMVADPSLGFSLAQVGTMTSIFPIAYGLSKFVSGIVGDRYRPSLLLGGGLVATAACNLAFGAAGSLQVFAAMWALNGLMQGVGAPSCARMLTSWFAARERGTYWGLWNVAHNTGGFAAPLVAASAAHALGWRWGMWAPGLAGLALGCYVLLFCKDTPQDAGFRPVEVAASPQKQQQPEPEPASSSSTATDGCSSASSSSSRGTGSSNSSCSKPGVLRTAMDNVLSSPAVWALAFVYFFVYVVRQGVTSWSMFYLMREKGVADAAQAAARVSGLELGGLVGGLAAGRLSDILIRRSAASGQGSVGVRVKVVMAYTAGLAASLLLFQSLPPGAPPLLQWLSVAAIGFCIYGPQMLVGLCGAELVHPDSVGASQGVLGWVAYLGAANAGVPLSLIIERHGWSAYFSALLGACGLALALLAPLAGLSSFAQRQHREQMEAAAAARGSGAGGDGSGVGHAKLA